MESWAKTLCDDFSGKFVDLPSLGRTHYDVFGAEGPWIVCVHGFGSAGWCLVDLAKGLAKQFQCRVLVYDLFGRGRSATPSGTYNEDFFNKQLWALVNSVIGEDEPISLIGNSMGSVISMVAATTHPSRVQHLILMVCPGIRGSLKLDWGAWIYCTPFVGAALSWAMGPQFMKKRITDGTQQSRDFNIPPPSAVIQKYNKFLLQSASDPNYVWALRNTAMNFKGLRDSRDCAGKVGTDTKCSVDIVVAEYDNTVGPTPPGAWSNYIPRATMHQVPMGHFAIWEHFPIVFRLISRIANDWSLESRSRKRSRSRESSDVRSS